LKNDPLRSLSSRTQSVFQNIPSTKSIEGPDSVCVIPEKKGKILLVDDNHFVNQATMRVLKNVLKEAGSDIEIIVGTDGSDIVHHVIQDQSKGNEIKCILTDENMEYLNGSEAIRIVRNLENRQKVKFVNIISVTSNEDSYCIQEITRAGAQIVLNKPLTKSVLARVLKDDNII
jgi:CheY-like chemotaxis protein